MTTIDAIYECLFIYLLAGVISLGIAGAIKGIVAILSARNGAAKNP